MQFEDIYFRFSEARAPQKQMMLDIGNALEAGRHILCHAEVGLGKTDAALSPAISYALKEGKKVFFLTPKISQHEIAVQVVKGLAEKFDLKVKAVDLVGRKYMCSDPFLSTANFEGFQEVCARRRDNEQCIYHANTVGSSRKQREAARFHLESLKRTYGIAKHHTELREFCLGMRAGREARPLCAYETSLKIARDCNVIIGDYFHVFSPAVQEIILPKLGVELQELIIIVDEAHNMPERIRSLMSSSISTLTLKRAAEEARKIGDGDLGKKLERVGKIIRGLAAQRLSADSGEALIDRQVFSGPLLSEVNDLEEFCALLSESALAWIEKEGYVHGNLMRTANFLEKWDLELEAHVRIIRQLRSVTDFAIMHRALDPSLITKDIFAQLHSAVLMSGTLMPTKMYADLLGLGHERVEMREYESPFPKENRLNLIVPTVTTKYTRRNAGEYRKIADAVAGIVNSVPGNSAVFFPSFRVLEAVAPLLKEKVSREIIMQRVEMTSHDKAAQIKRFRSAGTGFGAVLLAVASGSYAEGLDYPGSQLLCAVVVGIPLAEMNLETKSLIDYFQKKYGEGWHYGYLYPAISRAIQASGRVIRDAKDEGVLAFLDERYTWQNYSRCFPKSFKAITTPMPEKYVKTFWNN